MDLLVVWFVVVDGCFGVSGWSGREVLGEADADAESVQDLADGVAGTGVVLVDHEDDGFGGAFAGGLDGEGLQVVVEDLRELFGVEWQGRSFSFEGAWLRTARSSVVRKRAAAIGVAIGLLDGGPEVGDGLTGCWAGSRRVFKAPAGARGSCAGRAQTEDGDENQELDEGERFLMGRHRVVSCGVGTKGTIVMIGQNIKGGGGDRRGDRQWGRGRPCGSVIKRRGGDRESREVICDPPPRVSQLHGWMLVGGVGEVSPRARNGHIEKARALASNLRFDIELASQLGTP